MSEKYTVASLFAGIGGICRGFERAGAEMVWANEFDKHASITYRHNFSHKLYEDDIHNLTKPENIHDLPKVDILTSGFPCQAFSIAGYQKGFEDPRGNLFFETAKLIDEIRPKAFLLENVKNLVAHDHGRTFKVIRDVLTKDLKYSFIPFVLNSRDHGNVPQTRERIYMVGFASESEYQNYNSIKIYNIKNEQKYRSEREGRGTSRIPTLNFSIPGPIPLQRSIRDILSPEQVDDSFYYQPTSQYFGELQKQVTDPNSIYQLRRVYIRQNKTNVCPTLTANMGTGGHNVPLVRDDYGIRKLTPIECSQFQGFDTKFQFPPLAKSHLYKQVGNSVTVSVIERIAREILRVLGEKTSVS